MFGLGATELLIILAILVVLVGARRIPKLAASVGNAVRAYRSAGTEPADGGVATVLPAGERSPDP